MRTNSRCILALILSLLSIGAVGKSAIGTAGKDEFVNSLWVGKVDQHRDGQNAVLDAVLWIQSRTDDKCAGVLWYPSVQDGKNPLTTALFKVEIQLRDKGDITLVAFDVLYGKGWDKGSSDGTIRKDKLATHAKSGESVVDMALTRIDYN